MQFLTTLFRAAFPAEYVAAWFLFKHPYLWVLR